MKEGITSVNLSVTPFISSCDSTRTNMASKQFSQSLTHPNCEIPYVINNEWQNLSRSSPLGVIYAKDSGKVIYNNNDILIIFYNNLNCYDTFQIPPIKTTTPSYASSLRFSLPNNTEFEKDDVLYEYDAFKNGIPSSGYNCNTAYIPFFGFNHEDALVISESFAERSKHKYSETICVPIYEYTLLQKLYTNPLGYFPEVGEQISGDVVCASLLPQDVRTTRDFDTRSIKTQVINMLQNMNLSDLINMKVSGKTNGFSSEQIKTNIEHGYLSGFKIHRIKKDAKLIDSELQQSIEKLYSRYNMYILSLYNDLNELVDSDFAKSIIRKNYIYCDRDKIRKNVILTDAAYLIEFEFTKEETVHLGDKMSKLCAHYKTK